MTDKQLRKLKRVELLDMLIEQGKLVEAQNTEIEGLKQQIEDLKKQLEDHRFSIEQTGSIAEASLRISGVFEAAQKAALIYLDNLREKSGVPKTAEEALKEAMAGSGDEDPGTGKVKAEAEGPEKGRAKTEDSMAEAGES